MGFLNNLGFGLTVTLIGIAIVFLGLTILIGLIKLMENATATLGRRKRPLPRRLPRPWWKKCPWRMTAS